MHTHADTQSTNKILETEIQRFLSIYVFIPYVLQLSGWSKLGIIDECMRDSVILLLEGISKMKHFGLWSILFFCCCCFAMCFQLVMWSPSTLLSLTEQPVLKHEERADGPKKLKTLAAIPATVLTLEDSEAVTTLKFCPLWLLWPIPLLKCHKLPSIDTYDPSEYFRGSKGSFQLSKGNGYWSGMFQGICLLSYKNFSNLITPDWKKTVLTVYILKVLEPDLPHEKWQVPSCDTFNSSKQTVFNRSLNTENWICNTLFHYCIQYPMPFQFLQVAHYIYYV